MGKRDIVDCITGGGGYYLVLYGGDTAEGVTSISDPVVTCDDVDRSVAELTGLLNDAAERLKAKMRKKDQLKVE